MARTIASLHQLLPCRLVLLLLLIFTISSTEATTNKNPTAETVIQCLETNSNASNTIASAIYTPQNASYTTVLEAYIRNLRFNTSATRKPLFILTALHESHVQAAVLCARKHDLEMKIRSGGHDYEGISYWSLVPFFILDMFNFRNISVDPNTATAWIQVGATLGEVYYNVANKTENKYGFPAGVCPTVGVGGHLSGGGYGNMMRKYGLTVDNIIDAVLVDVNGRILDRSSMGEDLFWAITGGGAASFGVVLSYRINVVPVPEKVTVFSVKRTLEQNASEIVNRWQYVAPFIDDDLFIRMTLSVVNSTTSSSNLTGSATFLALYLGNSSSLLSLMDKSFPELGLAQSDCTEMTWLESVLFWTNFPSGTPTTALLSRTPQVLTHLKRKSDYVRTQIPEDGLNGMWKKLIELKSVALTFNPYGGKMAEVPATATPFPHRAGVLWKFQYATNWGEDGTEVSNFYLNLTNELHSYMTPFVTKNPREAFLNYRDLDLGINHNGKRSFREGKVFGVMYFKENFDRLVRVKTKVDPGNFFRNEQSIPTLPLGRKI